MEPICHRDWDDSQLSKSSLDLFKLQGVPLIETLGMVSNLIPIFLVVVVTSLQDCWVACVVTPSSGCTTYFYNALEFFGGLLTLDYGIKLRQVQA